LHKAYRNDSQATHLVVGRTCQRQQHVA